MVLELEGGGASAACGGGCASGGGGRRPVAPHAARVPDAGGKSRAVGACVWLEKLFSLNKFEQGSGGSLGSGERHSPATLRVKPTSPCDDAIVGGVRSAPFSTPVSLARGRTPAGESTELPAEDERGEDAAARVLEILSHRARRCSLSRSSPRGLTQCSRSSSSSSSSSRCLSGLSTPKKTLSSWFFALSSGVGGGTSYVGLRLMAQRESRTCDSCAGSLARVEREGRHGQLQRAPMLLASF